MSNWFNNLTLEDVLRWVRQIILFIGGIVVGKGWLSAEQITTLTGAIVALVSFLWSLRANTLANKVVEVNKSPEVTVKATATASPEVKEAAKA